MGTTEWYDDIVIKNLEAEKCAYQDALHALWGLVSDPDIKAGALLHVINALEYKLSRVMDDLKHLQ